MYEIRVNRERGQAVLIISKDLRFTDSLINYEAISWLLGSSIITYPSVCY